VGKKKIKKAIEKLRKLGIELPKNVKDSCCKKFKKGEKKRCKKCPCFDLAKKVA
jgi:predicted transcriptional regulator